MEESQLELFKKICNKLIKKIKKNKIYDCDFIFLKNNSKLKLNLKL